MRISGGWYKNENAKEMIPRDRSIVSNSSLGLLVVFSDVNYPSVTNLYDGLGSLPIKQSRGQYYPTDFFL